MAEKTEKQEQEVKKEETQEDVRKLVIVTDGSKFQISPETNVSPLEAEMICRKFLGI